MRINHYLYLSALFVPVVMAFTTISPIPLMTEESLGGDGCPRPNMISATMVTDTSLSLSWEQSDTVSSVTVRIVRMSDTTDVIEVDSAISPLSVTGLVNCELYGILLQSDCEGTLSEEAEYVLVETDGCCRIPSSFSSAETTDSSAIMVWDAVAIAENYYVRIKRPEQKETKWDTVMSDSPTYTFEELEPCTAYEAQVASICGGDLTDFSSSLLIQTLGCGVCTEAAYCAAGGYDVSQSWIDSFRIANVYMQSGPNDGYFAYTAEQTALERGRSYDFFVAPGFAHDTCPQYLRLWMDLDQDGSFNDSTELLLDVIDSTGNGMGGSFMLGETLPRDITRVRVVARPMTETDTIAPSSCGIFDFGEVEDYCIRVDEPCPIAENLDTLSVSENSATMIWDKLDEAFGYLYAYNEVGEERGELMPTGDTIVEVTDLDKCTEYEFHLISVCEQDTNGQVFVFKTYCETAVEDLLPLVDNISVYPNPFNRELILDMTAAEAIDGYIRVVSATGQELHREVLKLSTDEHIVKRIDALEQAAPGMYFVVLQSDARVHTLKVVKASY